MRKHIFSHLGLILKGFIILILTIKVSEILFHIVWDILQDTAAILNATIPDFFKNDILAMALALIPLLIISWCMGKVSFSKMLSMASRKRGLFCVRMRQHSFLHCDPNFPWTYAVGMVTHQYEIKGATHYNILFPHLGGMMTIFEVPAEHTERVEITPEDLIAASVSLGMMQLRKHDS